MKKIINHIYHINVRNINVQNENAKRFGKNEYQKLKQNIIDNGLISPIIVKVEKDEYILIDGYSRLMIFKELGKKTIAVKIV